MAFKPVLTPRVRAKISSWGLSDFVLVDVYRTLDRLRINPAELLQRETQPFDGMHFNFRLVDPENRLREHRFSFLVMYGQDEETLIVANAGYARLDGI